jgi:diaminopropionate ammonia-lyase
MPLDVYRNPGATFVPMPFDAGTIRAFHRRLPGYAPTALRQAPRLAGMLGVQQVSVKDETCRLDMPAFKILGASWATYQALEARLGRPFSAWDTIDELRQQLAPLSSLTLLAATDGNHGRAVARMARLLGLAARILVPHGTAQARLNAIAGEGAEVVVVRGSYDDAVRQSAAEADATHLVISDTAWEGYTQTPAHVIAGYSTIFSEIDADLERAGIRQPDLVLVQMGVGALASAVVQHYRNPSAAQLAPAIVGVEPDTAACVLASMRAGRIVEVPGPHPSIMAGLNAGLASPVAWPALAGGIDLFLAVTDAHAREAMRALAADGITAGETGAASTAGLMALMHEPLLAEARSVLGLGAHTHALVICTEGATDPASYQRIVGRAPGDACDASGGRA